ncbi:MAG: NAD-dependent DNA ligase LigA, partial [Lachnospiraceae bacterium]|nr:NAD-dependent DNA ligase LigA [Lachnospiraceae bacterium]
MDQINSNLTKEQRQAELTDLLDRAARAYEQENREIISNYEYDALYDELLQLEKETGKVLENSPTKRAGYEVLSALPKFTHESPMLSLDKTKDPAALASFLGAREGVLSWKMDGLTVVLTYRDGTLFRAVTRGNGEIGEVVTPNALTFKNLPKKIAFKGELVLRGEAIIKYSDFERINAGLPANEQFKNPRNLCSGAVRQLNSRVTAERSVNCVIFALIAMRSADGENPSA